MDVLGAYDGFELRSLCSEDVPAITHYLNNRKVWRNLRQPPFPFAQADAEEFITRCLSSTESGETAAIVMNGAAVGVLGYRIGKDIESRTATVGYWLGEPYWGRGIATAAVGRLVAHLTTKPEIVRIEGDVFGWNPASGRVLEKCGLKFEARLRNAVWKDEEVTDLLLYALVKQAS